VFAPTDAELRLAEEHLLHGGPLITTTASKSAVSNANPAPSSTCKLEFYPVMAYCQRDCSAAEDPSSSMCGSLDVSHFFSLLKTSTLGHVLFTAAATPSTQSIIQENVAKLPDGVVFVADCQTGGKGRGGNVWESPEGCLMFSACQRLKIEGQRLPFVQYLVTLAVVHAVQAEAAAALGCSERAPLPLGIKWPNDIYADGLKLGGVLCHSLFRDGVFHVIMGLGLNVFNRTPTTCVDALVEAAATRRGQKRPPPPIRKEALLAGTLNRLESMLTRISEVGFGAFEADYYASWLHSGQAVVLDESVDGVLVQVKVVIKGLSQHGYLLAEDERGVHYELHPDGNSLDFFKGLVRKKVG